MRAPQTRSPVHAHGEDGVARRVEGSARDRIAVAREQHSCGTPARVPDTSRPVGTPGDERGTVAAERGTGDTVCMADQIRDETAGAKRPDSRGRIRAGCDKKRAVAGNDSRSHLSAVPSQLVYEASAVAKRPNARNLVSAGRYETLSIRRERSARDLTFLINSREEATSPRIEHTRHMPDADCRHEPTTRVE